MQRSKAGLSRAAASTAAAVVLATGTAYAAGVGYDAEYRADYTDNVFLAQGDEDKIDELTHNYRVSLFGDISKGKAQANFIANLEYKDYQDDTSDDRALSSFIGVSEIALTSRSLSWIIADALGYYDPDPGLRFDTRDQQRVNYFMTGPVMSYAIGANNDINGKLLYTNHDRAGETEDFDKVNASLGWSKYLNNRVNIGLDLDHILMLYKPDASRGDYTTTELKGLYRRAGAVNSFDLSVGATHLETEDAASESSGTFNALWEHLFTRRFGSDLEAGYNLTEGSVLNDTQLNATGQFDSSDESGLFYESMAGARLFYRGIRSDVDFGLEGRQLEYVDGPQETSFQNNDHDTYRGYLNWRRLSGRALTFKAGFEAAQKNYVEGGYQDTLYTSELGLDYAVNRNLDLTSGIEYAIGESDLPAADGSVGLREYDEFQVSVGLHWDPFKRRRAAEIDTSFADLGLID